MMFGQIVAMLKARYQNSERQHLRFGKLEKIQDDWEYRMIFDSDTPASVRSSLLTVTHLYTNDFHAQLELENHTVLRFELPRGTEAVDMTMMQREPQTV